MRIQDQLGIINCKGSKILPYLQASKIACHSFIDARCQRLQPATENCSSKRSLLFGSPKSRECALP